jgi:hypothetical protein
LRFHWIDVEVHSYYGKKKIKKKSISRFGDKTYGWADIISTIIEYMNYVKRSQNKITYM